MPKGKFTVIGYYKDNDQPWVSFTEAATPQGAAEMALKDILRRNQWSLDFLGDIFVVGVFKGHHKEVLGTDAATPGTAFL